jgi:hypothetical protein
LVLTTLAATHDSIQQARDVEYLAGASRWLRENSPPGALVFTTDWDDFPYLFYHNTHNTYLVGLDPTYLQRADADLWDQWVAITRGETGQPSALIQSAFGARYVVSDTRHYAFVERAREDSGLRMVYRDAYGYVWEITAGAAPVPAAN